MRNIFFKVSSCIFWAVISVTALYGAESQAPAPDSKIGAIAGALILVVLLSIYTIIADKKDRQGGCSTCICREMGKKSCSDDKTDTEESPE